MDVISQIRFFYFDYVMARELQFKNEYVSGKATINTYDHTVKIEGMITHPVQYSEIQLIAASPPNRMTAYAGSGLPFPCSQIAFEGTPNVSNIDKSGLFNVIFEYPNSYYIPDMMTKIPPAIYFIFKSNNNSFASRIDLYDDLPVRSLVHRPNHAKGPGFYTAKESLIGVRSAEETMRYLAQYKGLYDIA